MTCRLFLDEVGNNDMRSESERFLSITAIITKVRADRRLISPKIEELKRDLFGHDPPNRTVVLHRKEIVRKEPPFETLRDSEANTNWEHRILGLIESLPYIAITVMIDKAAHMDKYAVWHFDPYHYCVRAVVERYVLWLRRHDLTGDVVAEPRFKQQDKRLKRSFAYIYDHGTEHIPSRIIQQRLTSREIKFQAKQANSCGLQLVEMIAHPSHQALKSMYTGEPMTAPFGMRVVDILTRGRYARNPKTGIIDGWGQKRLP